MQRYFDVVQNRQGTAVVGATVTVYDSNGNLATLYSSNGGAPTSNPVYTNLDGEYAFYAANGTYSIQITSSGYATETKPGVVLFDPSDSSASNNVQFLQAGTGAQVRSVQSKLRDVVSVKDFGAVGDGVADDTAAFNLALVSGNSLHVPIGTYRITSTLSFQNSDLIGEGWGSIIEGDIGSATAPLLQTGRSVVINNIALRFKSSLITGAETQGQRVLIATFGGPSSFSLQRGSEIRNVFMTQCGTAFYSPSSPFESPAFSVTFDTLEITEFSYRGFDFVSNIRTGNVYRNIYLKSSKPNVNACFYLDGEESETVIDQLNAEHTSCSLAPIVLRDVRALAANTIHIEGCDVSTAGSAYLIFENSSGSIESLSVYYTRMSENNTAIIKLGSVVYDDFGTLVDPSNMKYLRIGTLNAKGIARPDAGLYPNYPSTRRGLSGTSTITGFNFFTREPVFVARNMYVQIDSYVWNTAFDFNPDSSVYEAFPVDPNNNIAFVSKGVRRVDGAQFSGPLLMVGVNSDDAHPVIYDRNGNDYRPSFTWWFDDNTGFGHPAAGEVCVTLNNLDKYRFKTTGFVPSFDEQVSIGLSTNRWTNVFSTYFRPGAGAVIWTSGNGTPEGVVTAPVGSLYTRSDGGAGTTLYVKESGSGNTGWIAK